MFPGHMAMLPLIPNGYSGTMFYTFYGCENATLPDGFVVPNGYSGTMFYTFYGCENATLPDGFVVPSGVTNLLYAFSDCTKIGDISNIWPSTWNKTGIDMQSMFNMHDLDNNISGTLPANKL